MTPGGSIDGRRVASRAENVAQASALRREGLEVKAIAERMGVHFKTVYEWLEDPMNLRSNARKRVAERAAIARRACERCGGSVGSVTAKVCSACVLAVADERAAEIAALREEGLTNLEIEQVLGLSFNGAAVALSRAKLRRGFAVPRSPYWNRKGQSMQQVAMDSMRRDLERSRATLEQKEAQLDELRTYINGLEAAISAFEKIAGSTNGKLAAA